MEVAFSRGQSIRSQEVHGRIVSVQSVSQVSQMLQVEACPTSKFATWMNRHQQRGNTIALSSVPTRTPHTLQHIMAEQSTAAEGGGEIEINVRPPGGDKKVPLQFDTSKTVAELKDLIAEKTEIPAENQRLIYSGRVLKNEETVSTYKIRTGDTVHLVKGAAKAAPPPAQQQVPQSISTGNQVAGNPLAPLLNATNPGIGNFNPFAEMGLNTNDPNMMQNMMQSPQAQEQMRNMLSNPAGV